MSHDECPYTDTVLATQWRAAKARGDFIVLPCCHHIKVSHRSTYCLACAAGNKECPGLPTRDRGSRSPEM